MRRVLMIATALALLGAARADGALCVVAPQVTALTDRQGAELLSGDGIDAVFPVREGALYAAGRRGAYRLYDASGLPRGDAVFGMIADAGEALVFREGDRYGVMDASGAVLLSPRWTQLTADGEGGWLALDGDPLDDLADELIHLDASGRARRTGVYTASGLEPVECGRMPYMSPDGRWGAVDARGEAAIEPAWRGMSGFRDGVAVVSGPNGRGLIDAGGTVVIEPAWDWVERCDSMLAAKGPEGVQVYAPDGSRRLFSLSGAGLEAGLTGEYLWVSDAASARLYTPDGALIAKNAPGTTYAPGSGGQVIVSDGAWGEDCVWLIDSDGGAASEKVQQLLSLGGGLYAWLEMNGIEYYSAELGMLQRSWDYSDMRYGLMDAAGRRVTPAMYREIRPLGEDRLLMLTDDAAILSNGEGVAIRTWSSAGAEAATGEAGA